MELWQSVGERRELVQNEEVVACVLLHEIQVPRRYFRVCGAHREYVVVAQRQPVQSWFLGRYTLVLPSGVKSIWLLVHSFTQLFDMVLLF